MVGQVFLSAYSCPAGAANPGPPGDRSKAGWVGAMHDEIDIHDLFAQVEPSFNPPAVVQHSVARGELPALIVVHDAEDYWLVGDGVGDPNLPDACGIYHFSHLAELDPTIAVTMALPRGHAARRDSAELEWRVERWEYSDES
jgi:hypothetical protein